MWLERKMELSPGGETWLGASGYAEGCMGRAGLGWLQPRHRGHRRGCLCSAQHCQCPKRGKIWS